MHPLAFRLSASKSTPENKGCGASAKKPTNGNESATNEGATAASPRARAAATAASNFSHRARTCVSQKCPAVSHVYATSSGTPSDVARRSTTARSSRRRCSIALTRPCREKSRSVSRSRSPCPRRSRYRAGTSRCMSFWNRSLSAALECVMSSVRCPGSLWYRQCMICVAVSVLPVPGGPTTIVSPGCTPLAIAETCVGVNRTAFKTGWSSGYGPGSGGTYDSTRRIRFETEPRSSSLFAACKSFSAFSSSAPSFSSSFVSNATLNGGTGASQGVPSAVANRTSRSGKHSRRCSASRKVSLKSTVASRCSRGMFAPCAAAGSPYPRNTSCSQSGTGASAFIRSRMHSRMDLKLFSFGRRRISTFSDEYTSFSEPPRSTSSWYCAASSSRTNVRSYPEGPTGAWPSDPRERKSFRRVPSPSRTSTISAPRARRNPKRSAGDAPAPSPAPSARSRNTTSCCLSSSHSSRAGPRSAPRLTRTSHRTLAGLFSPTRAALTSVTASAPGSTGTAMRDHPVKRTDAPSSPRLGAMRLSTSAMSSLIS
mmetsp:Transcript_11878/g.50908  ORF Transcript_11878/g.50908 Transcript_11878/m.50908 type:complete len:541 (-) Transcript_11878:1673-3295(-)